MTTVPDDLASQVEQAQRLMAASEQEMREQEFAESVLPAPDLTVTLPGGLLDFGGVRKRTAIVREMNGYDEEELSRQSNTTIGQLLMRIIARCSVSLDGEPITADVLSLLYSGDWDALLLGIKIATYGPDIAWAGICPHCGEDISFVVDLSTDVKRRDLQETSFTYAGKRNSYDVGFPSGSYAEVYYGEPRSAGEMVTELLASSVISIDGKSATRDMIRRMPLADRDELTKIIQAQMPTVLLGEVSKPCTECGEAVPAPLSPAALFQG